MSAVVITTTIPHTRFPAIDFSLVHPDEDVLWTAEHRETKEEIRRRGLAFLQWLAGRWERRSGGWGWRAFMWSGVHDMGQMGQGCWGIDESVSRLTSRRVRPDNQRPFCGAKLVTGMAQGGEMLRSCCSMGLGMPGEAS